MNAVDAFVEEQVSAVTEALASGADTVVVDGDVAAAATLNRVDPRLRVDGHPNVLVAPPRRYIDSPALALIDCAVGLADLELDRDSFKRWTQPGSWWERTEDLRGWLKDASSDGVILVCDNPEEWALPAGETNRRAESAAELLLYDNDCRKVVVGEGIRLSRTVTIRAPFDDLTFRMLEDLDGWASVGHHRGRAAIRVTAGRAVPVVATTTGCIREPHVLGTA